MGCSFINLKRFYQCSDFANRIWDQISCSGLVISPNSHSSISFGFCYIGKNTYWYQILFHRYYVLYSCGFMVLGNLIVIALSMATLHCENLHYQYHRNWFFNTGKNIKLHTISLAEISCISWLDYIATIETTSIIF